MIIESWNECWPDISRGGIEQHPHRFGECRLGTLLGDVTLLMVSWITTLS